MRYTARRKCCSSFAKMMRAVCVDVPGGPENLLLRAVPRPRPKGREVLIKVHATALNRADLLQVQRKRAPNTSALQSPSPNVTNGNFMWNNVSVFHRGEDCTHLPQVRVTS